LMVPGLSARLGQQVVVDNRGGSVIVPAQLVAKAAPDGYTILLYSSNLWLWPFMRPSVPYELARDYVAVTMVANAPQVLVVNPSVSASSVKDLISLAKAKPGQLNYAAATGGSIHIAAELFKAQAGVNLVQVPYKGGGPGIVGLMANEVQVMFPSAGTVAPYLKSGRLKALAVTSLQPSPLFEGLPTVAGSGLPGYEAVSRFAVFLPAGAGPDLVGRLNADIVTTLKQQSIKERFATAGIEVAADSPQAAASTIKNEMAKIGGVIRSAGIRID
jgi:tripartite-type tricarboxylate transporter receptor subunit TctC